MPSLLRVISIFMWPVTFIGCVWVAMAFVGGYMVTAGYVLPGQPMYLDELAPSIKENLWLFAFGIALIGLALFIRHAIRRALSASGA